MTRPPLPVSSATVAELLALVQEVLKVSVEEHAINMDLGHDWYDRARAATAGLVLPADELRRKLLGVARVWAQEGGPTGVSVRHAGELLRLLGVHG